MRPGEKLFEELGFDAEKMSKTAHPKIFIGRLSPSPLSELETALGNLGTYTSSTSAQDVRNALRNIVVEMLPESAESATLPKRRTTDEIEPTSRRSILPELVGSTVR
jgi:FlaA1/EpsC-like NDP-sugar epimerase